MNPYKEIDFAKAWREIDADKPSAGTSETWDERAKTYDKRKGIGNDAYGERFAKLLGLKPGERALDMGCGTGLLTVMFAGQGHPIVAADFSDGMLSILREKLAKAKADGDSLPVEIVQAAWEDDWPACGIAPKSVDVAYASRSMAVRDLGDAVDKMSATARRRCAVTLSCAGSPRCNDAILEAVGRPASGRYDAAFLIDILWQKGFFPEVAYIESGHVHTYDTREALFEDSRERLSAHGAVTPEEDEMLSAYVKQHAQETDGKWSLEAFNNTSWAFVGWNVPKGHTKWHTLT